MVCSLQPNYEYGAASRQSQQNSRYQREEAPDHFPAAGRIDRQPPTVEVSSRRERSGSSGRPPTRYHGENASIARALPHHGDSEEEDGSLPVTSRAPPSGTRRGSEHRYPVGDDQRYQPSQAIQRSSTMGHGSYDGLSSGASLSRRTGEESSTLPPSSQSYTRSSTTSHGVGSERPNTVTAGGNRAPSDGALLATSTGSQRITATRLQESAPEAQFPSRLPIRLRTFASIPRGDYRGVEKHIESNPSVLDQDPQIFLEEASLAYAFGKTQYGNSCVQQHVILKKLRQKPIDRKRKMIADYFHHLRDEKSRTREQHFTDFDECDRRAKRQSQFVGAERERLSTAPEPQELQRTRPSDGPERVLAPGTTAQQGLSSRFSSLDIDPSPRNPEDMPGRGELISKPPGSTKHPDDRPQGNPREIPETLPNPENHLTVPRAAPSTNHRFSVTGDNTLRLESSTRLDFRYSVKPSKFYNVGRVFAVLWHEPFSTSGNQAYQTSRNTYTSDKNVKVSSGRFGEPIYSTIRRMVVIREARGFCVCIQINTYGGRGLRKFLQSPRDVQAHSRIHMVDSTPRWLEREPESEKRDIAVRKVSAEQKLDSASRLCYSRPHTVEHTVKSMDVGQITQETLPWVLGYYQAQNSVA